MPSKILNKCHQQLSTHWHKFAHEYRNMEIGSTGAVALNVLFGDYTRFTMVLRYDTYVLSLFSKMLQSCLDH